MEDVYKVEKIPNENRYGVYVTHPDYADNWGSTTMLVATRATQEEAEAYAKNREYDKMAKGGTMEKYYGGGRYDRGTRPSPRESATLFMPGYRRVGQDGNMYVIVENVNGVKRWQRERRYEEGGITNQYAGGGEVPSPFSIGDIVQGKGHHAEVFYTIITEKEIGGGHYAYKSDAVGNPIVGNYAYTQFIHSFDFKNWVKISHKELETVTKHGLSYYKSGDLNTDVYLALLDGVRSKYFWENAPKNLKSKFRGLENDNWHYKSAELVNDFFNHPTWKHLKNHKLAAEEGMLLSESEYARGGTISSSGFSDFFNKHINIAW